MSKLSPAREVQSGTVLVGNTAQSVTYTELLRLAHAVEHRLRIVIRANAYVDQSHGEVERWDGARWQQVFYLHGGEMQTEVKGMRLHPDYKTPIRAAFYSPGFVGLGAFAKDRQYLIDRAIEVLS